MVGVPYIHQKPWSRGQCLTNAVRVLPRGSAAESAVFSLAIGKALRWQHSRNTELPTSEFSCVHPVRCHNVVYVMSRLLYCLYTSVTVGVIDIGNTTGKCFISLPNKNT